RSLRYAGTVENPPPVEGDDDERGQDEEDERTAAEEGDEQVQDRTAAEVEHVVVLPPQVVRGRRPDEATGHIADREQTDEAGGRRGGDAEIGLNHRSRVLEDADSGGDVEEQGDPEEPELRGPYRVAHGHIALRLHRLRGRLRGVEALRCPIGMGDTDDEGAGGDD